MVSTAEAVPHLSDVSPPLEIMGTAALTTAAMNGVGFDTLLGMIDATDDDAVARMFDMSVVCMLASRRMDALELQAQVVRSFPLLRVRNPARSGAPLRVLALLAPGDLMVNTPLDFITAHLDVRLDLLFLVPGRPLPAVIPDHDVLFVAISEADRALLDRVAALLAGWPRPVINDPAALPVLARDRLSRLLTGLPGLCSPAAVSVCRNQLQAMLGRGGLVSELLPGATYPVLIRPRGSHAGHGLQKVDGPDALAAVLAGCDTADFYLTAFIDYRAADGLHHKYRVACMDGQVELCHMAASPDWMVHYLNAGMTENADRRAMEAAAMAGFNTGFARRHADAFAVLMELLPFDYFSVDCSELPDGRLLVFEADTGAIVHLMEDAETFPYKHAQMRLVFNAFDVMLRRHAGPPRPVPVFREVLRPALISA